jgi:hypothetical protein
VLRRRLEGIRKLKTFYEDVHAALLGHLPALYSAMKAADQQVLHQVHVAPASAEGVKAESDSGVSRQA